MTRKILVVEDDASTSAYLAKGLSEAGYAVEAAHDGRDGLFLASEGIFDLIIADRMLPGLDGLAMVSAIRAAGLDTPVLILSALGAVDDRVDGLKAGADDYLCKPFSFAELSARIEALVRRSDRAGAEPTKTRLSVGDLEIDLLSRAVTRAGRSIPLGAREFNLLEFLARHAGQVVTRTMMLEVLQEDYIRTARAKGLREPKVIVKHALKNALIPVVTVLGIQITNLIGGSVISETIFAIPGLGRLMVSSITARDYPVVQGIVVMTAVFVMLMNLAVDVSYGYLDPRARPA